MRFSQNYACEDCGFSMEELTPQMFSFNNPYGACPDCTGLGTQLRIDPALVMPNMSLSIEQGGITASGWGRVKNDTVARMYFDALAEKYKFSLSMPLRDLPKEIIDILLYGTKGEKLTLHYDRERGRGTLSQPFEGIVNNLQRRYNETQSMAMRWELEQ